MASWSLRLLIAAVFLQPFVGVGVAQLLLRRDLGTGVQPAFLALVPLVVWMLLRARPSQGEVAASSADRNFSVWMVALLLWAGLSLVFTWRSDTLGLAGEVPWLKSLKQFLLLAFFVGVAVVPTRLLNFDSDRLTTWARVERAWSVALVVSCGLGLLQVLYFRWPGEALGQVLQVFTTNPSIAAGSEELYLGHRFVGIARMRGPFPEPLHFGSYLLASIPLVVHGATHSYGWSRRWRLVGVGLALLCLSMTFSRGAYLGAGAMLVAAGVAMVRGVLPRPTPRQTVVTVAVILGTGLLLAGATGLAPWSLPGLLWDRLVQSLAGHDMSNLTRLYAWRAALGIFGDHLLAGVGWGAFGFHYYATAPPGAAGAHFGWPMTNSLPLLIAAELGAVGLVLAGRALWPCVRRVIRPAFGTASGPEDTLAFALATASLGVLVHGLTFSQWNLPHLWLLLGLSAVLGVDRKPVV